MHVKRLGSFEHTDGALLDLYQMEHAGVAHRLYLDAYRWTEPVAPSGLLCGAAMGLEPPPPDPFETQILLSAVSLRFRGRQTSAEYTVGPSPNQIVASALPTTNRMMKMSK